WTIAMAVVVMALACGKGAPAPQLILEYEVAAAPGHTLAETRDRAIAGLRHRLDVHELRLARVARIGEGRIRVELAGHDAVLARYPALLDRRGEMSIQRVDDGAVIMQRLADRAGSGSIHGDRETWHGPDGSVHTDAYLVGAERAPLEQWIADALG